MAMLNNQMVNPSEMVGGQQFGSPNSSSKPRMALQI